MRIQKENSWKKSFDLLREYTNEKNVGRHIH